MLVRVTVPESTTRFGCDVVVAIDVSGSMGENATYEDEAGNVCTDGLSVLNIAQHAVKVIAASLTVRNRIHHTFGCVHTVHDVCAG